jgi:pimeloyl-ACP methyl ester carboxylesterase
VLISLTPLSRCIGRPQSESGGALGYPSPSLIALAWAVSLTSLVCAGCAGVPDASGGSIGGQSTDSDPLEFFPCDITTSAGTLSGAAECAEMTVPARRSVAHSRSVTLSLKRYKTATVARGQLWLVAGGPGSAASDFEVDSELYSGIGQGLELYFMDHRGTGRSTRLACPAEEEPSGPGGRAIRGSEWASCAKTLQGEWGADLAGFNPTEAATDLGEAIDRTRRNGEPVFVYSVSYGTYLAERYLQLYPQQPTGLILDSICSPGRCDMLVEFDRQFDATARKIFEYCASDETCSTELGQEPVDHVTGLSKALAEGHCPELGWSSTTLRQVLGFMVMTAGLRDYMPAVVKRAERCTASDVAALAHFQQFIGGIDTESTSFSAGLSANIILSELSARPMPTADEVTANVDPLIASVDAGPKMADAITAFPLHDRDRYFGSFGATDVPLLMLNGTLDPQTPLSVAEPAGDFYRGTNQHFVQIPYSPHTTLTQSLINGSGDTCGAELARQFLDAPTAPLDMSCLSLVLPLDFSGSADITELIFGTRSPWNDTTI